MRSTGSEIASVARARARVQRFFIFIAARPRLVEGNASFYLRREAAGDGDGERMVGLIRADLACDSSPSRLSKGVDYFDPSNDFALIQILTVKRITPTDNGSLQNHGIPK